MSKTEPVVSKYMTCQPLLIDEEESVASAMALMKKHEIRHLPVVSGERIVGILSDRDVRTAMAFTTVDPEKMKVKEIDHEHPYQVQPDTPLHLVAAEMAAKHYGSALVVQHDELVGIFTTMDACRTLAEVLQQRYRSA